MTVEDLVYWIYESGAANGKYIRADRKPISPDEAAQNILSAIELRLPYYFASPDKDEFSRGYNSALSDIKQLLNG